MILGKYALSHWLIDEARKIQEAQQLTSVEITEHLLNGWKAECQKVTPELEAVALGFEACHNKTLNRLVIPGLVMPDGGLLPMAGASLEQYAARSNTCLLWAESHKLFWKSKE